MKAQGSRSRSVPSAYFYGLYALAGREEVVAIPVGAFADPAFPAPAFSVYEERMHAGLDARGHGAHAVRQSIGLFSLVVREDDEALAFYVGTLGFTLVEDTAVPEQNKRWVVVAPPGSPETRLLLARAANAEQLERVGNQTGGRVFLFSTRTTSNATIRRTKPRASCLSVNRRKNPMEQWLCSRTSTETCGISCNRGRKSIDVAPCCRSNDGIAPGIRGCVESARS